MIYRMPDQPDLVGSREACRDLDVDKSTLTRWAADGTIAVAHRLPGKNGALLFDRAEIARLKRVRAEKASA